MVAAKFQPRLEPTAAVLRAAVAASGRTRGDVAKHLGLSQSAVSTMMHAKSPLTAERARKLGALLKIDPATIVSPPVARKRGSGKRPPGPGPATRAMLADLSSPTDRPAAAPGVFGMQVDADGVVSIWLKARLPAAHGFALTRYLLDFGLIAGSGEPLQNGKDTATTGAGASVSTGKG